MGVAILASPDEQWGESRVGGVGRKALVGQENESDLVTIKGIVIPFAWDRSGKVTAIAISTAGEREYLVHDDAKGKELQEFIQEFLEINGSVMDRESESRTITVRDFSRVKVSWE
jgi:hypothetical protein